MTASAGVAVPYTRSGSLIADRLGPNNSRRIYYERFDRDSWAQPLPARVPLNRAHDMDRPLGWAELDNRDDGLHALVRWIDGSRSADDARAEVRSRVLSGLSIGFLADEKRDSVTADKSRGGVPTILRRGVRLVEVSLVAQPAHDGARITRPDVDGWQHEQSEALQKPFRDQQAAVAAQQRRADRELMDSIEALAIGAPRVRYADASRLELATTSVRSADHLEQQPTEYRVTSLGDAFAVTARSQTEADHRFRTAMRSASAVGQYRPSAVAVILADSGVRRLH